MLYHSTNNPSFRVDLKEAILRSLPPDNGLYMPDALPVLGDDFWQIWRYLSFQETGFAVADAFFGTDVPAPALREIVEGTLAFDAPSREMCSKRRILSNTPLQALATLNDPQFIEAARHLAEVALKGDGTDDARLDRSGP